MIDQDKIILMTRLASYEKNEGKKNEAIGRYFRGDYIGWQVLKSIVSGTLVFLILFAGYVIYDFENFMIDVYKIDLLEYAKSILIKYAIVVGAYAAITYGIYAYRYAGAKKKLRTYAHNLNKLSKNYTNKE
ncbi:MAG: hypothetical protein K6G12_04750 [Lachnospiraceae bacterium]|nr:hypothetical protein [Lachnospiraceae bacterium]